MEKNSYQVSEELDGRDRIGLVVWAMNVPERKVAESLARFANGGNESALRWAKHLVQHGVTDTMRSELRRIVGRMTFRAQMKLDDETGKFVWNYAIPLAKSVNDDYVVFAFMVARLVDSDLTYKVKRCELEECRKFFVGNAKARYCHDNCGAKVRARKMRREAKGRGIAI